MIHIINKGTNQHVIFLLHGTGGTAESMIDFGKRIDSKATHISIQGEVDENGMNRYFARYPDGSFNLESLKEETEKLNQEIKYLIEYYQLENYQKTILGYSNGANIATNLFKEFETDFDHAILYHPSAVREESPVLQQFKLKVFMTYGHDDPFLSQDDFLELKQKFEEQSIPVTAYMHSYGHQIIGQELEKTKTFIGIED